MLDFAKLAVDFDCALFYVNITFCFKVHITHLVDLDKTLDRNNTNAFFFSSQFENHKACQITRYLHTSNM